MSIDHSATTDKERLRVRMEHPNDPTAISERWDDYVEEYAWFVKNRARFTRSIGDSCMKDKDCAEFYNANIPRGNPNSRDRSRVAYRCSTPPLISLILTYGRPTENAPAPHHQSIHLNKGRNETAADRPG